MFNRKLLKNIDWLFVFFVLVLLAASVVVQISASRNVISSDPYYILRKQLIWIAGGIFVVLFCTWFNYDRLGSISKGMYGLIILLLIGVLFMDDQKGAHRWYDLGFMDFQPSELAKVVVIIAFAWFLSSRADRIKEWSTFFLSFLVVGVPMLLICIEPDLGTSLVFLAILLAMMWVSGIPARRLIWLFGIMGAAVLFVFADLYVGTGGFQHIPDELPIPLPLKGYQLLRLIIFINPNMDPLNTGYHIIQSEIAVGSGGFFGKGFAQGSQVQGNFLPEHHTDFIFSVVGEEFGFVGAVALVLVYSMIIWRALRIARRAKDMFGTLIVVGIVAMFAFQVFVNIGMTIGLMPITGLPLPFMSYGGTSMMINMMCVGLILSVNSRQEELLF